MSKFRIYDDTDEVVFDNVVEFSLPGYMPDTITIQYNLTVILPGLRTQRSDIMRRTNKLLRRASEAVKLGYNFVWFEYNLEDTARTVIRSGNITHNDGLDYHRSDSFANLVIECNAGFEETSSTFQLDSAPSAGGFTKYDGLYGYDFVRTASLGITHAGGTGEHFVQCYIGMRDFNEGIDDFNSRTFFADLSGVTPVTDTDAINGEVIQTDLSTVYAATALGGSTLVASMTTTDMLDISTNNAKHLYGSYKPIIRYKMPSNSFVAIYVATDPSNSNVIATTYLTTTGSQFGQIILPEITIPFHNNRDSANDDYDTLYFFFDYISGDHAITDLVSLDCFVLMPSNNVLVTIPNNTFHSNTLEIQQTPIATYYYVKTDTAPIRIITTCSSVGNFKLCAEGGVIVFYFIDEDGIAQDDDISIEGELVYGHSGF